MARRIRRFYREREPDMLSSLFLMIFGAVWNLIQIPFRRRGGRLDQATYRDHWDRIVDLLHHENNQQHWKHAVLEGDKLLDQAFRDLRLPGTTFGERLKGAEFRFSHETYNHIWEAHKLRNRIAHELAFELDKQDAEFAINGFAAGLQKLGAL